MGNKMTREEFIEKYMSYTLVQPEAKHLNDCKSISKHYNECIVLENGQVLELKGSHEQTAMKWFGEKWDDIDPHTYNMFYWVNKYKIMFIHSYDFVSGPAVMSNLQRQTINMFISRELLSKDYAYRCEDKPTYEETREYDYK